MNLFHMLINELKSGQFWIVFILIVVIILVHLSKVYEFFSIIRNRHKQHIDSVIRNNKIDNSIRNLLKNELDKITFKEFTGLYISKVHRENLIILINKIPNLTLREVKLAGRYFSFDDNNYSNIKIDITWKSFAYVFFCAVTTLCYVAIISFFIIYIINSEHQSNWNIMILLTISLIAFSLSVVYMKDISSFWTALKIKKLIKK